MTRQSLLSGITDSGIFIIAGVVFVLFLTGCASKEEKAEREYRVPQSQKNEQAWAKLQAKLEERRKENRPTRGDIDHFHNQDLQVFPHRDNSRRSERLYENKDESVFKLW